MMTELARLADHLKFHDDFNWTDDLPTVLYGIIQKGRLARGLDPLGSENLDWDHLGKIVAVYLDGRRDVAGWLNKTQAVEINHLSKRAQKMLEDITRLQEANAFWYVQSELGRVGLPPKDQEVWLKALTAISTMKARSPKLEPVEKRKKRSLGHLLGEDLHSDLQAALDRWWTDNTGLPKDVSDDLNKPYAPFLQELYGRMRLHNAPGASHSAVQAARKVATERQERVTRGMNKLRALLDKREE